MILAGIDEAGYGPLLGPLVVGCCAFEIADGDPFAGELPCLWKRLRKLVSKNRTKAGKKLHVNDSKLVYSSGLGVKELERSILAILATIRADACSEHACGEHACSGHSRGEHTCDELDTLLARVAGHAVPDLRGYPWYLPQPGERFPLEQDLTPIRLFANALRAEMDKASLRCVHLAARVVPERQFNKMVDATRNKGSALFSTAVVHLDHLIRTYGDKGLVIFCDRQGGREHYGSLLRLMFEDWSLEVTRERDGHSEYKLLRGPHVVRVIFCEKAEAQCMPVALASMLSKYLREALMGRFNAYWKTMLPDVTPTAGYYSDGTRFLQDIDVKRRELGIADEELIRSR
ncbi:MAG: hypothetical protein WBD40_24465 [Tepidisphaeraceae bacterium]